LDDGLRVRARARARARAGHIPKPRVSVRLVCVRVDQFSPNYICDDSTVSTWPRSLPAYILKHGKYYILDILNHVTLDSGNSSKTCSHVLSLNAVPPWGL